MNPERVGEEHDVLAVGRENRLGVVVAVLFFVIGQPAADVVDVFLVGNERPVVFTKRLGPLFVELLLGEPDRTVQRRLGAARAGDGLQDFDHLLATIGLLDIIEDRLALL
jgi:hypothetical protein